MITRKRLKSKLIFHVSYLRKLNIDGDSYTVAYFYAYFHISGCGEFPCNMFEAMSCNHREERDA